MNIWVGVCCECFVCILDALWWWCLQNGRSAFGYVLPGWLLSWQLSLVGVGCGCHGGWPVA